MNEPTYHQFKLRMPVELKDELERHAERNSRSLSAEILHRLEQSFEERENVVMLKARLAVAEARMEAQQKAYETIERLQGQLGKMQAQLMASNPEYAAKVQEMQEQAERFWAKRNAENEQAAAETAKRTTPKRKPKP